VPEQSDVCCGAGRLSPPSQARQALIEPPGGCDVRCDGATVRVAVNGYGVIGKRVADSVTLQDDMELVGVADVASDYRIRVRCSAGWSS